MLATRQSLLVQIRLDLRFVTFMRDPLLPLFDVMAMAVVSKLVNGSGVGQVGPVDSYGHVGDFDLSLVIPCILSWVGQVRPVDSCGQVRNIDLYRSK